MSFSDVDASEDVMSLLFSEGGNESCWSFWEAGLSFSMKSPLSSSQGDSFKAFSLFAASGFGWFQGTGRNTATSQ